MTLKIDKKCYIISKKLIELWSKQSIKIANTWLPLSLFIIIIPLIRRCFVFCAVHFVEFHSLLCGISVAVCTLEQEFVMETTHTRKASFTILWLRSWDDMVGRVPTLQKRSRNAPEAWRLLRGEHGFPRLLNHICIDGGVSPARYYTRTVGRHAKRAPSGREITCVQTPSLCKTKQKRGSHAKSSLIQQKLSH